MPPRDRPSRARRRLLRTTATVPILLPLAACAAGAGFPAAPPPSSVPSLEAQAEARPEPASLARLGAAYHVAGRYDDAVATLRRAVSLDPQRLDARLYLGFAHEELDQPTEALEQYRYYVAQNGPGADRLNGRIRLLRRAELRAAVRSALEREARLAGTPPDPNTVAVFPFLFAADDETLRPLARALAEMLATDLAQTDRLEVLERVQVQALLDEVALSESGLVDPASATRGGRLIGAGQIVQGRLEGTQARLGLEASVVEVATGGADGRSSVSRQEAVDRLFEMEKAMALALYDALGVSLTPAEREAVNRRPTENLQAILAFGRGLAASDEGDYETAVAQFNEAVSIDPGFAMAAAEAAEAGDLAEAQRTGTDDLVATAGVDVPPDIEPLDLIGRDPAAEVLGTEVLGAGGTAVTIIIRTPGGGS